MKFKRTELESELLDIRQELIDDVRIVKKKSDAKSHRNKYVIAQKINIIDDILHELRCKRTETCNYRGYISKLTSPELIKYFNKIFDLAQL